MTMAHEALAKMFNDPEMLPYPNPDRVRAEVVAKFHADQAKAAKAASGVGTVAATSTGVNVGTSGRPAKDVRSWGTPKPGRAR